jgi:hypothetical protein
VCADAHSGRQVAHEHAGCAMRSGMAAREEAGRACETKRFAAVRTRHLEGIESVVCAVLEHMTLGAAAWRVCRVLKCLVRRGGSTATSGTYERRQGMRGGWVRGCDGRDDRDDRAGPASRKESMVARPTGQRREKLLCRVSACPFRTRAGVAGRFVILRREDCDE